MSVYFHVFVWWSCLKMQTLFNIKRGRKFIDGPDTGYSISCQNKNKFLGFCKLSIIELKLLTGISLNTVMMIMMTMLMVIMTTMVMLTMMMAKAMTMKESSNICHDIHFWLCERLSLPYTTKRLHCCVDSTKHFFQKRENNFMSSYRTRNIITHGSLCW